MNMLMSRNLAVLALVGSAGAAFGQESVTFAGVDSMEAQGNGANEHRTASLVGGYDVGSIHVSGTLTEVLTATYASEARLRVTSPSGQVYVLQPFTVAGFTGSISVVDYGFNLPASEAATGDWDIEFYESYNDGPGADAHWDTITLTFTSPLPPPANDNCGDAQAVVVGAVYPGATALASNDAAGSCGLTDTAKDVWYSFTAPHDGEFTFSTCDAIGFDTVLSLWDTCGGTELVCDDDTDFPCTFSVLRSELHHSMANGESVLIRIAGYNGATGSYVLHVGEILPPPPPPANDECSGAAVLTNGANQAFDTTSATDSGIGIAGCGLPTTIHNDLYYTYQASCTGDVTIATCGTSYDTVLAVFDACGGNQVACDDDSCDGTNPPGSALASTLTFSANAGTTYVVVVGTYLAGTRGPGLLSIDCAGSPPVCPADFNGDGFLDFFDYDDFVNCFESGNCPPGKTADYNGDGFADFFDYDAFVGGFEAGC